MWCEYDIIRNSLVIMVCTQVTFNGAPSQTISSSPLKSPSGILMSYLLHGPRSPDNSTSISATYYNTTLQHDISIVEPHGHFGRLSIQKQPKWEKHYASLKARA